MERPKLDPKKFNLRVSTQVNKFDEELLMQTNFIQRALSIAFAPTWAFGTDILTKFINLSKNKSEIKIFYTVSHIGVIYNHSNKEMQFLMGHQNLITSVATDDSGKWLVTADNYKDNTIIVWDSDDCFPVRTIFDPHPDVGVIQVAISHDAKYIVSVGAEVEPIIKFWSWTFSNDEADGSYTGSSSFGQVQSIKFNPNESTHFSVTFSNSLLFFTWKKKTLDLSIASIPLKRTKNYGQYSDSLYIPYSHECFTVTSKGWVLVWGLTFFTVPYDSMPDNNEKIFLKAIRLQRDGICCIMYIDGVISTTDDRGNIRFYDEKLKILYLCHKFTLPPIIVTSFNLGERKFIIQDPLVMDSDRIEKSEEEEVEFCDEPLMYEGYGYDNEATNEAYTKKISNEENTNNSEHKTELRVNSSEKNEIRRRRPNSLENVEERRNSEEREERPSGQDLKNSIDKEPKFRRNSSDKELSKQQNNSDVKEEDKLETESDKSYKDLYPDPEIKNNVEVEQNGDDDDDDFYSIGDDRDEDRSEDYEKLYLNLLPSDFTLQRAPFLVRDYIILTVDGKFAYVDAIENKLDYFLCTNFTTITSMDVHSEKPILILGYLNGFVYAHNYEESQLIVKRQVMNSKEEQYNVISCVKYSPQGLFLVCGTGGGHLIFLDPVTLEFQNKVPFVYEHSKIFCIVFSSDNQYLAYYDESKAVCLLKRKVNENDDSLEWVFHGRFIAHTKEITGMLFVEKNRLFTIAKDRYLVEYYVKDSQPGRLEIMSRISIMQKGYPIAFTTYDIMGEDEFIYFLISTNEFKYLIINEHTSTLERTIVSPFFEKPISQIRVVPNRGDKYLMFSTGKFVGIQLLPLSGNPYKQVTHMAHSYRIKKFEISFCGKYAFTTGKNDNVCIMWAIRAESLDFLFEHGGKQLCPYYSLIEGGSDSWLFNEIKDLFYYMQILHQGEDSPFPRNVSDKIPTVELPNLMRAIGFYPTEYELDNILYEVKYYYIDNVEDEEEEDEINFENFVKLYINHRPVRSFKQIEIKWAFKRLGIDGKINRDYFIEMLCSKGEAFTTLSLQHCLSILTTHTKGEQVLRYAFNEMLPEELTYDHFMTEILGVDENYIN